jgi:probable HAF family extracellular repeat protein
MRTSVLSAALLIAHVGLEPAIAQQAQFIPLGGGIGFEGISADGMVTVGDTPYPTIEAFRWTSATGLEHLGFLAGGSFSLASGVNRDGSVIVGRGDSSGLLAFEAFVWTPGLRMVNLGALPGSSNSASLSVSLDGSVVVGTCEYVGYSEAFRWTNGTGMVGLGGFPGQPVDSDARATNGDGSVVVGVGKMGGIEHPFRWTSSTGMVSLGFLPGCTAGGAEDVSADGSVVVGVSWGTDMEAFRWTPGGGMVGLGDLAGGPLSSVAWGVSPSGLVIVGSGRTAADNEAVFWTPSQGPISIEARLTSLGVTSHNGWRLTYAHSVSADGLRIIGGGFNPLGQSEGWIAILPHDWMEYCTAKVNSLGCTPSIAGAGVPSASNAWSFEVVTSNVLNEKAGLYLYKVGGAPASVPFQGGTLCVGPSGIRRTPVVFSGGSPAPANDCSGAYELDFNAFAAGLSGGHPDPALLSPGSIYRCQAWGRDQGFSPPNNTSLSNALQVPIGP